MVQTLLPEINLFDTQTLKSTSLYLINQYMTTLFYHAVQRTVPSDLISHFHFGKNMRFCDLLKKFPLVVVPISDFHHAIVTVRSNQT